MKIRHLLSLDDVTVQDLKYICSYTDKLKQAMVPDQILSSRSIGLLFYKSSTRTRVSFEVGINQLGGHCVFLSYNEMQLNRGESVKDTARVLSRYLDGLVIRTYKQQEIEAFAAYGDIPVINALSDMYHPCQLLADLYTIEKKLGSISGKTVVYIGDGSNNMAHTWIAACARFGMSLRIAAPGTLRPAGDIVKKYGPLFKESGNELVVSEDINVLVKGADVLYTDVWISMGQEKEEKQRLAALKGYQINNEVLAGTGKDSLVMHCLPAHPGQEIAEDTFEACADTIFDQAENRLHVQKGILYWLFS